MKKLLNMLKWLWENIVKEFFMELYHLFADNLKFFIRFGGTMFGFGLLYMFPAYVMSAIAFISAVFVFIFLVICMTAACINSCSDTRYPLLVILIFLTGFIMVVTVFGMASYDMITWFLENFRHGL